MSNILSRGLLSLAVIALCLQSHAQEGTPPKPEYFGFYALDGNKLVAIGDGKADNAPTLQQVNVVNLGQSQASQRTAVRLGAGVRFLLFDAAPAETGRSLSIYRLPFIGNEVTFPDVVLPGRSSAPTVRQRNLPGVMRLASSQIRLLVKPVPSQPQMIEFVPDPPLQQGLYGVLFAPATGVAVGGVGAGQKPGWTALLLIGESPAAEQSGQCIDLSLTGGLGGMLGIDSPDVGQIASFPLLDPRRVAPCSSTAVSETLPRVAPCSEALSSQAHVAEPALDIPVDNVMKEYGSVAAWRSVSTIRESGKVVPAMRKGDGAMTRFWQKPGKLRIDIVYPADREVRVYDCDHGTRNEKEVSGPALDAMKLQAVRIALPLLLVEKRASLHDLGMRDGFRAIEIPLSSSLTVTVDIDPKSWHIVRSTGKTNGLDFVVDYSDFRRVDGLLFAFGESGMAQGTPTAKTTIDTIVINGPSTPPPPAAQ